MDFTTFVLSHLGPPAARVLEVGCGQGQLALALDALGYDVVAVDPVAPEGPIFRRIEIEELVDSQRFDAAVASYSLHHVVDLDLVLDKLRVLLKPEGVLVVDEFGWDLIDEATAGRYGVDLAGWDREHDELHRFAELRKGLENRFVERHFTREPYFCRHTDADEDEERRLIETGEILPLGFRFVGRPR